MGRVWEGCAASCRRRSATASRPARASRPAAAAARATARSRARRRRARACATRNGRDDDAAPYVRGGAVCCCIHDDVERPRRTPCGARNLPQDCGLDNEVEPPQREVSRDAKRASRSPHRRTGFSRRRAASHDHTTWRGPNGGRRRAVSCGARGHRGAGERVGAPQRRAEITARASVELGRATNLVPRTLFRARCAGQCSRDWSARASKLKAWSLCGFFTPYGVPTHQATKSSVPAVQCQGRWRCSFGARGRGSYGRSAPRRGALK